MKKIRLIFLFPLGLLYGIITYFRRFLYKKNCFSSYKPPIKTICVGNIAVGGTGKTPHVEYLIRLLSTQYAVATLSRGYKRLTHGYISTFTTELPINALTIGDEPQTLIIGRIQLLYVDPAAVSQQGERYRIDASVLNPLARLGANQYASITAPFTLERPA